MRVLGGRSGDEIVSLVQTVEATLAAPSISGRAECVAVARAILAAVQRVGKAKLDEERPDPSAWMDRATDAEMKRILSRAAELEASGLSEEDAGRQASAELRAIVEARTAKQ